MLIHAKGKASGDFMPDQISAYVNFTTIQKDYITALEQGVNMVNNYIAAIAERTGFSAQDFKTNSYNIREHYHMGQGDNRDLSQIGKERRISDGFEFTQRATIVFDYDRERLENLLLSAAYSPEAPHIYVNFELKDPESKKRELLPQAFAYARTKAQTIADAAGLQLAECKEVFLDEFHQRATPDELDAPVRAAKLGMPGLAAVKTYEDRLQKIDASFHPEPITLTKHIDTLWSTN